MSKGFISNYALPVVLAIIMFGIRSLLEVENFKRIVKHPKQILIGLTGQMLLPPVIACILAAVSSLPPLAKADLVLLRPAREAPPPTCAYLLKEKLALAVSMTALNSLLTLLSVPHIARLRLLLSVGEDPQISLPSYRTVPKVFYDPAYLGHKRVLSPQI